MKKYAHILILALALSVFFTAPLFASEGGGVTPGQLKEFGWKIFNTAILFYLLYRFAIKPLIAAVRNRKDAVREALEQAQVAKEKAEEKYKEYQEKIANLDAEIKIIVETLRDEGEIEKKKIIESAAKLAEEIILHARELTETEVKKAKIELKNEAIIMSVKIAEDIVKKEISEADHKKIVSEYFEKLGAKS